MNVQRTTISVIGGILLLLASLGSGIGGAVFATSESLLNFAQRQTEEEAGRGNLTPAEKRRNEENRANIAKVKEELDNDPAKRQKLEDVKTYGGYEVVAALVGIIGGIGLLTAGAFGKYAGIIGAVMGLLACIYALSVLGAGMIVVEGFFMVAYGLAIWGALSLKPAENVPAAPAGNFPRAA